MRAATIAALISTSLSSVYIQAIPPSRTVASLASKQGPSSPLWGLVTSLHNTLTFSAYAADNGNYATPHPLLHPAPAPGVAPYPHQLPPLPSPEPWIYLPSPVEKPHAGLPHNLLARWEEAAEDIGRYTTQAVLEAIAVPVAEAAAPTGGGEVASSSSSSSSGGATGCLSASSPYYQAATAYSACYASSTGCLSSSDENECRWAYNQLHPLCPALPPAQPACPSPHPTAASSSSSGSSSASSSGGPDCGAITAWYTTACVTAGGTPCLPASAEAQCLQYRGYYGTACPMPPPMAQCPAPTPQPGAIVSSSSSSSSSSGSAICEELAGYCAPYYYNLCCEDNEQGGCSTLTQYCSQYASQCGFQPPPQCMYSSSSSSGGAECSQVNSIYNYDCAQGCVSGYMFQACNSYYNMYNSQCAMSGPPAQCPAPVPVSSSSSSSGGFDCSQVISTYTSYCVGNAGNPPRCVSGFMYQQCTEFYNYYTECPLSGPPTQCPAPSPASSSSSSSSSSGGPLPNPLPPPPQPNPLPVTSSSSSSGGPLPNPPPPPPPPPAPNPLPVTSSSSSGISFPPTTITVCEVPCPQPVYYVATCYKTLGVTTLCYYPENDLHCVPPNTIVQDRCNGGPYNSAAEAVNTEYGPVPYVFVGNCLNWVWWYDSHLVICRATNDPTCNAEIMQAFCGVPASSSSSSSSSSNSSGSTSSSGSTENCVVSGASCSRAFGCYASAPSSQCTAAQCETACGSTSDRFGIVSGGWDGYQTATGYYYQGLGYPVSCECQAPVGYPTGNGCHVPVCPVPTPSQLVNCSPMDAGYLSNCVETACIPLDWINGVLGIDYCGQEYNYLRYQKHCNVPPPIQISCGCSGDNALAYFRPYSPYSYTVYNSGLASYYNYYDDQVHYSQGATYVQVGNCDVYLGATPTGAEVAPNQLSLYNQAAMGYDHNQCSLAPYHIPPPLPPCADACSSGILRYVLACFDTGLGIGAYWDVTHNGAGQVATIESSPTNECRHVPFSGNPTPIGPATAENCANAYQSLLAQGCSPPPIPPVCPASPPPPPPPCMCGCFESLPPGTKGGYIVGGNFGHFVSCGGYKPPAARDQSYRYTKVCNFSGIRNDDLYDLSNGCAYVRDFQECINTSYQPSPSPSGSSSGILIAVPHPVPHFHLPPPAPAPIWGYEPRPAQQTSTSSDGGVDCMSVYNTLITQCLLGEEQYKTPYCNSIQSQYMDCMYGSSSGSSGGAASASSSGTSSASSSGHRTPAPNGCTPPPPPPPPPPSAAACIRYMCGEVTDVNYVPGPHVLEYAAVSPGACEAHKICNYRDFVPPQPCCIQYGIGTATDNAVCDLGQNCFQYGRYYCLGNYWTPGSWSVSWPPFLIYLTSKPILPSVTASIPSWSTYIFGYAPDQTGSGIIAGDQYITESQLEQWFGESCVPSIPPSFPPHASLCACEMQANATGEADYDTSAACHPSPFSPPAIPPVCFCDNKGALSRTSCASCSGYAWPHYPPLPMPVPPGTSVTICDCGPFPIHSPPFPSPHHHVRFGFGPGPGGSISPPHVYPYDGPPIPSFVRDDTYRDLCLSSRVLTEADFDPTTGAPIIRNADGSINNDETFFGSGAIAGAKPGYTCMPMKGTPVNDLGGFATDPKLAFAWHMNMGDATSAPELVKLKGIYKWDYDQTLSTYGQPVGGNLYCGAQVLAHFALGKNAGPLPGPTTNNTLMSAVDEKNIVGIAYFRMAQLANCAYQYVMMRGILPYYVYEPLGSTIQEYLWPPLSAPAPIAAPFPMPPGASSSSSSSSGGLPVPAPAPAPGPVLVPDAGADPREPAIRYCQPLIEGDQARKVYLGQMKQRDAGYAYVLNTSQYPWADENEYLISEMLYQAWQDTLVTGTAMNPNWHVVIPDGTQPVGVAGGGVAQPDLRIFQSYYTNLNLPCLKTVPTGPVPALAPPHFCQSDTPSPLPHLAAAPHPVTPPAPPPPHYPAPYSVQCLIGSIASGNCVLDAPPAPGPSAAVPAPFVINSLDTVDPVPPSQSYATTPIYRPQYCLSVEKYNDPTNPFAPRQRYVPVTDSAGNPIRDSRGHIIPLTDRKEYEPQTSEWFRDTSNGKIIPGFTAWSVYNKTQQALYPPVRAAIVPVDIMDWRQEIFDNCMQQRIILDRNAWKKWMKTNGHANAQTYEDWVDAVKAAAASPGVAPIPPSPYHPPCSISYNITDNPASCMAQWSMQQCAAFAARPLVGDNFIKLRTPYTVRDNIQKAGLKPVVERQYMAPTANGSYEADLKAVEKLNEAALGPYPGPLELPYIPKDANFAYYFPVNRDPRNGKFIGVDMPYMRWYDTGTQAGQEPEWWGDGPAPQARRGISFSNTLGSFDVGGLVGRSDGRTAAETGDAVKLAGEASPAYPAWDVQWLGTTELPQVGAYGLFHNRLLDQAYSMRYNHFNCLPRYELAFKQLDQMDFALARAGAQITLADNKATPVTWYKGFRGYGEYAFMKDDKGNSRQQKEGFPYINNATPTRGLLTGLDNADADDIITINYSDPTIPGSSMPRTYYVIGKYTYPNFRPSLSCLYSVINCFDPNITWSTNAQALLVISMNTGKHLSSIGITDQYGISRVQTIFKSDSLMLDSTMKGNWQTQALDKHVLGSYALSQFPVPYNVGITPDCTDTDYAYCTVPLTAWNTAVVWHALPRLNQPVAIPSPAPSPIPNAMVIVGNFGFNDCSSIDPRINQIPPSETNTYPNAIQITMNCFNQGMDPPMKPFSNYNWSSVGQGGLEAVGADNFTQNAVCPPECITRRLPVSPKVPNPWPLLEMEYCIQPKKFAGPPPKSVLSNFGLHGEQIIGATGAWGSGWATCRFAYEGNEPTPNGILGISEPPPRPRK